MQRRRPTCWKRIRSIFPVRWRYSLWRWPGTRPESSLRRVWSRPCAQRSRGRALKLKDSGGGPMTRDDRRFLGALAFMGGGYVVLILAMLAADLFYTSPPQLLKALATPEIRYAIWLTLITASLSAVLSVA